jgi:hypothetical protein
MTKKWQNEVPNFELQFPTFSKIIQGKSKAIQN